MSKTIDDFRDFYKIQKEKEDFKVSNAASLAVNIISPTLKKKKIDLKIDIKEDITIKGYENEYAQVILNFLSNSVDVLLERKIESPTINIEIDNINNNCVTKVYDKTGNKKRW